MAAMATIVSITMIHHKELIREDDARSVNLKHLLLCPTDAHDSIDSRKRQNEENWNAKFTHKKTGRCRCT